MAKKLLIVHGYSDGSTSFKALGNYFVEQGVYDKSDVYYVDYASMDDQATFRDFADKLESEYRELEKDGVIELGERIDVACHSTGSLVTRAWLVLHRERARQLDGIDPPCPVDRLLMFAPANFGSDLAGLGQSVLGRIRSSFKKTAGSASTWNQAAMSCRDWSLPVRFNGHCPLSISTARRPISSQQTIRPISAIHLSLQPVRATPALRPRS